ncbi:hypothetical protein DYB28_000326 [Aphanomyces astaci]|uniref:Uncharacterized protein n=2 Tax=Aphanomyces astaci TaxID=112090 RepID=A0A9X8H301_APHAT|nr:hypothetical protein DYB28_000326 [Aphanomyces astaci]
MVENANMDLLGDNFANLPLVLKKFAEILALDLDEEFDPVLDDDTKARLATVLRHIQTSFPPEAVQAAWTSLCDEDQQVFSTFLSGEVVLTQFELNTDEIKQLQLPVELKSFCVGKLRLRVPLAHLTTQSAEVATNSHFWDLDSLYVAEQSKIFLMTLLLDHFTSDSTTPSTPSSSSVHHTNNQPPRGGTIPQGGPLTPSLVALIQNSHIIIERIHVRFEDGLTSDHVVDVDSATSSSSSYALGVTLASLVVLPSTPSTSTFAHDKKLSLTQLSIYLKSDDRFEDMSPDERAIAFRAPFERDGTKTSPLGTISTTSASTTSPPKHPPPLAVLEPLSLDVRVQMNLVPVIQLAVQMHVPLVHVNMAPSHYQYLDAFLTHVDRFDRFSLYRRFRPVQSTPLLTGETKRATNWKDWWRYAIVAVMMDLNDPVRRKPKWRSTLNLVLVGLQYTALRRQITPFLIRQTTGTTYAESTALRPAEPVHQPEEDNASAAAQAKKLWYRQLCIDASFRPIIVAKLRALAVRQLALQDHKTVVTTKLHNAIKGRLTLTVVGVYGIPKPMVLFCKVKVGHKGTPYTGDLVHCERSSSDSNFDALVAQSFEFKVQGTPNEDILHVNLFDRWPMFNQFVGKLRLPLPELTRIVSETQSWYCYNEYNDVTNGHRRAYHPNICQLYSHDASPVPGFVCIQTPFDAVMVLTSVMWPPTNRVYVFTVLNRYSNKEKPSVQSLTIDATLAKLYVAFVFPATNPSRYASSAALPMDLALNDVAPPSSTSEDQLVVHLQALQYRLNLVVPAHLKHALVLGRFDMHLETTTCRQSSSSGATDEVHHPPALRCTKTPFFQAPRRIPTQKPQDNDEQSLPPFASFDQVIDSNQPVQSKLVTQDIQVTVDVPVVLRHVRFVLDKVPERTVLSSLLAAPVIQAMMKHIRGRGGSGGKSEDYPPDESTSQTSNPPNNSPLNVLEAVIPSSSLHVVGGKGLPTEVKSGASATVFRTEHDMSWVLAQLARIRRVAKRQLTVDARPFYDNPTVTSRGKIDRFEYEIHALERQLAHFRVLIRQVVAAPQTYGINSVDCDSLRLMVGYVPIDLLPLSSIANVVTNVMTPALTRTGHPQALDTYLVLQVVDELKPISLEFASNDIRDQVAVTLARLLAGLK